MAKFARMKYTSSFKHYIKEFKKLANHVHRFSIDFIAGLKDDLCHEVTPFRPWIVIEAKNLALQQEGKAGDLKKTQFHFSRPIDSNATPRRPIPQGIGKLTIEEQQQQLESGQ